MVKGVYVSPKHDVDQHILLVETESDEWTLPNPPRAKAYPNLLPER